ncbi:hypothetical protein [Ensifer sp. LCM 4579]|uniref:hypothetical protein n=1 Tax=Ensifer sp. LCM 4579 TaxID=1848292 RepID=UPI0008DA51E1|nr:hypothetical protein [Ensifer sp. LCM 4579]OHV85971.1 hypothetical protein LCM4579_00995 [Ensifer sp. LCM 4579]
MPLRLQGILSAAWFALASALNVPLIRFIVAVVAMWAAASLLYGYAASRTIVVEALASTVRIELKEDPQENLQEDLGPLALGPYDVCRLKATPDPSKAGPSVHGCAPDLFDVGDTYAASLQFPKGSVVEFRVTAGRLEIEAVELPESWQKEEYREGTIFSVDARRLSEFGTLTASGIVSIGAAPGVDKGPLHSGRYRLYGRTLTGLLLPRIGYVPLAEGDVPSGAFLTFASALSGKPLIAHLQFSAPGSDDDRGLGLLAISKTDPVDLKTELFRTEPVLLRPTFSDALLKDPLLVVLLTFLSAVAAARDLLGVGKGGGHKQAGEGRETQAVRPNKQISEDPDALSTVADSRSQPGGS